VSERSERPSSAGTAKNALKQGYAKGAAAKVKRDAFLYIDGKGADTGQCSSCKLWVKGADVCIIHGMHVTIKGTASCGLYVPGKPVNAGLAQALVTPEESGLVERKVRCQNCRFAWSGATVCGLFQSLSERMPEIFDLDTKIEPQGCCNAQSP